jgi:hypothetical protein
MRLERGPVTLGSTMGFDSQLAEASSFCTRLLLPKCKKALTRASSISPLDAEAAVNADANLRKHE